MDSKMIEQEKFRNLAFGLSIIILLNRFLYIFAESFHFVDIAKVFFFGGIGLIALVLGLFKFHRSLSWGLVIGGIIASRMAYYYYHFNLTNLFKFLVSMTLLAVLLFGLYKLYNASHQNKKGK